ncbi:hypothetical protein FB45DRAFT_1017258 [Roridomyces roridus]|uniref:Uncharacterized protein n=1 Tax=Roridomyces roridus TaxID=1738132 RepID=A0AAD7CI57_9AGAR|nr:hypothetical protein FB45DRAFT_1017258 [Roridomyces roridus]
MSFISNASGITLGEGTFNNVHGNLVNIFPGRRRRREHGDSPDFSELGIGEPTRKRRRKTEMDEPNIIRERHLDLTLEIGSGPGYLLHAGEVKGRAVIVKVFNAGPSAREHLEATVSHSRGLLHPNVLRIRGRSSPTSSYNFIAYEHAFWQAAEGPLAAALKDDLERSIVLGFKLVAGLSSGINYLDAQDLTTIRSRAVLQNYNVFLDINDRFLFSIDFPLSNTDTSQPEDDTGDSWSLFNALCQKVLRSANRVLHEEDIERAPAALNSFSYSPPIFEPSPVPLHNQARIQTEPKQATSKHDQELPPVPPRREYVWRKMELPQSLSSIATKITRDLDLRWRSINRLTRMDALSVHRCPGYVREEITLTTRTADSAVVSHDAPAIQEVCSVCHEVVDEEAVFCSNLNDFICEDCVSMESSGFESDDSDLKDLYYKAPTRTLNLRHTVIIIDILPEGSLKRATSPSPWSHDNYVTHASTHPRRLHEINPTVSFTSGTPLKADSRFTVYSEDIMLHAESVPLQLVGNQADGPFIYSTVLVPQYWATILNSPDPSRFIIFHEVIRDSDALLVFSATYKFCY